MLSNVFFEIINNKKPNNKLNISCIDMQIRTSYNNNLIRIIKKIKN